MTGRKIVTIEQDQQRRLGTQIPAWLRSGIVPITILGVDYLAMIGAVGAAYLMRLRVFPLVLPDLQEFQVSSAYTALVIPLAFLILLHFSQLYQKRLPFWQQAEKLLKACIYSFVLLLTLMYLTGDAKQISRIFMVLVFLFSFPALLLSRFFSRHLLGFIHLWERPVLVIGIGKAVELLHKAFTAEPGVGYTIISVLDHPEEAEKVIQETGVREVFIAAPGMERDKLLSMIYRLQPHVDRLAFVPDLAGIPVGTLELETLLNGKTVVLKVRNNLASVYNRAVKSLFDLLASAIGTLLLLPVFLTISLLIYLDSPGPVVFAHHRIGSQGKVFSCYKFRTMVTNGEEVLRNYLEQNPNAQEEWENDFKLRNDPRITKIGHFLRKTSLDELPQLLNVLKREMSLVGPRPIIRDEMIRYGDYIYDYLSVRPGITGIWQVSGRNDVDYDERVQMDSWYVRNWSLWLDIVLLCKTFNVVLKRKGAY